MKEYSEFFIGDEEKANNSRFVFWQIQPALYSYFRGETKPLYDTNIKKTKNKSSAKLFCWMFILAILAGVITVGVLIGSKSSIGFYE